MKYNIYACKLDDVRLFNLLPIEEADEKKMIEKVKEINEENKESGLFFKYEEI